MPAATTHCEFAKSIYKEHAVTLSSIVTDFPMYCLGSQGPDVFFFHKANVLKGSLSKVGNQMHDEWAWPAIHYMKEHCTTPSLKSYFYGYLTHYALDSSCHPIINAYAAKIAKEKGVSETEVHFAIEGEIDGFTLAQQNRTVSSYSVYNDLHVSKNEAKELAVMYHGLFSEVMHLQIEEKKIEESVRDIYRYTKWLKPTKNKFKITDAIENITHMPKLVTGLMLTNKENAHPCVLNENKETWEFDGRKDTRGFIDLKQEATVLILKLFNGPNEADVHRNFCGNEMSSRK